MDRAASALLPCLDDPTLRASRRLYAKLHIAAAGNCENNGQRVGAGDARFERAVQARILQGAP